MATPVQQLHKTSESGWKDRYHRALQEFEEKEKAFSEEESGLYKSILRLIFTYTGEDAGLDRQLSSMRDKLRQESGNQARKRIINPVIEEITGYAREKVRQKNSQANHLQLLLQALELPGKYSEQLEKINHSLANQEDSRKARSLIKQLAKLISKAANSREPGKERIPVKADDPLTQLLENLSLPGELGIEVIALRKRAGEIEEEQERLQLIQDLVQLFTSQGREDQAAAAIENFPHLKETLLELFEWLSIPEQYSARVETVKSRIAGLQVEPDLSAVLRDTAIVINDLQEALQLELGDIQNFLAKVTSRLEEVENCFRELTCSEIENLEETQQLNTRIENDVRHIREGIANGDDINEIKQTIESRLSFIEQSVEGFLLSTQARQQSWQEKVSALEARIHGMKGETTKLHRRIQEEYKRAKTDALTGIPNRLAYNEKIRQEIARWQRNRRRFSICVVDADRFKLVNDTYGHKAGDKVLKTIAEVCAAKIRKVDFIARYGGEEFVLLLPETDVEQARGVAENLRREIETCKFHYAKEPVAVTVSCGIAEIREDDSCDAVFTRADKALYKAKQQGRNQVVCE